MRRVIFSILSTLFLCVTLSAQTPDQQLPNPSNCTLTRPQAPVIRDLKLDMTSEQLLALVPESFQGQDFKRMIEKAQGYPNYGYASLYFQPMYSPPAVKDRFAGIENVSVTLFDGRVTEIRVNYLGSPSGPNWLSVDDFIAKLSQGFALPSARDWLQKTPSTKILKCSGMEIEASIGASGVSGQGSISLRGNTYREAVKARVAADEERRRSEFKP
jgi:hypothetical protein